LHLCVKALPNEEKDDVNIAFFEELVDKLKLNRKGLKVV
jgi:hypothetical protein